MTGIISTDGERRLVLISGRAHPQLADDVARELGVELVPTTAYDFANGEIYVRFGESVRGADAFVLQSHTSPINQWIMEQLIMVDALKRASAKTITVIVPFYGYSRQDKKHRGREPISARLMADLFRTAGADRLMSVDLHAAQTQGFFDGPVDHLWAMPLLVDYVRTRVDPTNVAVVSPGRRPDPGRRAVGREVRRLPAGVHPQDARHHPAQPCGGQPRGRRRRGAHRDPHRRPDRHRRHDRRGRAGVPGRRARRTSSSRRRTGVLSEPAAQRLAGSGAREVVVTDTLPIEEDKGFEQLTVLSIAPLIARAVREVFDDGSVTSLFDGAA